MIRNPAFWSSQSTCLLLKSYMEFRWCMHNPHFRRFSQVALIAHQRMPISKFRVCSDVRPNSINTKPGNLYDRCRNERMISFWSVPQKAWHNRHICSWDPTWNSEIADTIYVFALEILPEIPILRTPSAYLPSGCSQNLGPALRPN